MTFLSNSLTELTVKYFSLISHRGRHSEQIISLSIQMLAGLWLLLVSNVIVTDEVALPVT